jgi:diguanylate cyclase (GGDEF)-like protein/PAS domain S-box-containing protein
MVDAGVFRRLRVAGLLGIVAVAAIAVLQGAILLALSISAPNNSARIDASGLRRSLTVRILYDAESPSRAAALSADVAHLSDLQQQFDDLSPANRSLIDAYLRAPNQRSADLLFNEFNRLTALYSSGARHERQRFRDFAIAGSFVIVLVCAALYLFVLRPTEHGWMDLVARSEERRERFAAVFEENIDMMAVYAPDGTIQRTNRAALERIGFTDAGSGETWRLHVARTEWPEVAARFADAAAGFASEFETIFVTQTGLEIDVLCTLVPVRVGKSIVGVVGQGKDLTEKREAERALERSTRRLRSMFENNPAGIIELSPEGRIVAVNEPLEALTGYAAHDLVGERIEVLAPVYDQFERRGFAASLIAEEPMHDRGTLRRLSGEAVPVQIETIPMRSAGAVEGSYVIVQDISAQVSLEFKEQLQRQRLSAVSTLASSHARDAQEQVQRTLEFAMVSLGVQMAAVGYIEGDLFRVAHSAGIASPVGAAFPFSSTYARHVYGTAEILSIADSSVPEWADDPARTAHGWQSFIGTTIRIEGRPVGMLTFASRKPRSLGFDRADEDFVKVVAALMGAALARLQAEARIASEANIDPLTRLPNRSFFEEELSTTIARIDRDGGCAAILFIDLDGFKNINDSYGHAVGDDVLRAVANRCLSAMRSEDLIARLGGDEFIVLQGACLGDDAAMRLAERLIAAVSEPIVIAGTSLRLGASVGVALYPRDASNATALIASADRAMYAAKKRGDGAALFHTL